MSEKNWIQPPLSNEVPPLLQIGPVGMFLVADLREGNGFLQIVEGDSAMAIPTPSCRLQRGQMLVVIPAEVAEQMRPELDRARAEHKRAAPGGGLVM